MPRPFHLTRIASLIVAGATVVSNGAPTLQEQVRYAVTACRVDDPLTGASTVAFDVRVPPPESTTISTARHLAAAVLP